MKQRLFRPLTRIPRLYYNGSAAPREKPARVRLADALYGILLVVSYGLFVVGGIFGYAARQLYGLALFTLLGYAAGIWIRRSLGIRGQNATTGFFQRMRERAQGSRPGTLEWILEMISGRVFTPADCRAVVQAHEVSVKRLKEAKSPREQNQILAELDRKVHQKLSS